MGGANIQCQEKVQEVRVVVDSFKAEEAHFDSYRSGVPSAFLHLARISCVYKKKKED